MTATAQDRDRRVAVVFSLIVVGALIFDASHRWFWQRAHDTAPVAALLTLLLAVALLRRHRFAWWVFVIICAAGIPAWIPYGIENGLTSDTCSGSRSESSN